jgi:hypothetical protein
MRQSTVFDCIKERRLSVVCARSDIFDRPPCSPYNCAIALHLVVSLLLLLLLSLSLSPYNLLHTRVLSLALLLFICFHSTFSVSIRYTGAAVGWPLLFRTSLCVAIASLYLHSAADTCWPAVHQTAQQQQVARVLLLRSSILTLFVLLLPPTTSIPQVLIVFYA